MLMRDGDDTGTATDWMDKLSREVGIFM